MKVRVRTLSNEEVEIEAEPENGEKVASLKEKIEKQWSHMPAARQRLVHAGKVLGDAQLLSDTSLKEGDRVVVMLTKTPAAAAPAGAGTSTSSSSTSSAAGAAQSSAASSSSSTVAGDAAGTTGSTKNAVSASGTPAASSSAAAGAAKPETATGGEGGGGGAPAAEGAAARGAAEAPTSEEAAAGSGRRRSDPAAESVLQTGPQLEETLEQLVAMGFPRDRAEQAMRAAFNNPNRAVEYLMNGLPQDVSALLGMGGGLPSGDGDAAAAAAVAAAAEELQQAAGDAEDDEGLAAEEEDSAADSSNPLAALRRHPAFSQIRQMVQANPAMLPQVLQLIGSSNPQLLELITQNQDAFLEVLQQEDADEGVGGAAQQQQHGDGNVLGGVPGTGVIQITRDEMEALQRLEALGFTRHQAVEAYLACDRDEEMAANFLLENINDLEGDGPGAGSGAAE